MYVSLSRRSRFKNSGNFFFVSFKVFQKFKKICCFLLQMDLLKGNFSFHLSGFNIVVLLMGDNG
jgi:hypothetical protein